MKVDRDEKNRLIYIYSRYDEANPNMKEQGDVVLYADEVLHIPGLGFDVILSIILDTILKKLKAEPE